MSKFKMINRTILFIHMSGGLGNQLFQISNVVNLLASKKQKKRILVFLYTGNPKVKKEHEFARLSDLGIRSLCLKGGIAKWLIRLLKVLGKIRVANVLIEGDCKKTKLNPGLNFVEGLYQKKPTATSVRFLNSKMRFKSAEGHYSVLHIRLGDYLSKESKENVGLVANHFYQNCLKTLFSHDYPIWVVSDGTKEQVDKILEESKIPYQIRDPDVDIKDLEFIANAKIVAICNSTFSLWACYLKNKTLVYYPSVWFPARDKNNENNPRIKPNWLPLN